LLSRLEHPRAKSISVVTAFSTATVIASTTKNKREKECNDAKKEVQEETKEP
jgi:hypothetical protein